MCRYLEKNLNEARAMSGKKIFEVVQLMLLISQERCLGGRGQTLTGRKQTGGEE